MHNEASSFFTAIKVLDKQKNEDGLGNLSMIGWFLRKIVIMNQKEQGL